MLAHPLRRPIACLAVSLLTAGALVRAAPADTKPISSARDVRRLPDAAARLYADVTVFPREMKYRQIPWLLSLEQGIRLAKREKRPLLIWTSGDDPLERC
jgi:hypothetical protein